MPGMISGGMPGMIPPQTDGGGGQQQGPGFGAFNLSRSPEYAAAQAQFQIRELEKKLMEAQRNYAIFASKTNNPQQLAAYQANLQQLQQQIEWAKQNARQKFAMEALKMQQASNMPGAGSVGVGQGSGGRPNQGYANQAQLLSMMAGMFGGGSGADRNW